MSTLDQIIASVIWVQDHPGRGSYLPIGGEILKVSFKDGTFTIKGGKFTHEFLSEEEAAAFLQGWAGLGLSP